MGISRINLLRPLCCLLWLFLLCSEQVLARRRVAYRQLADRATDGVPIGQRQNLVIAAVGDSSIHERWLTQFDNATWDLATFYFGKKGNFTCDKCVHVESGSGTKWSFLYKFGMSDIFQKTFSKQYKQVYVTDDDIIQTTDIVNRAFAEMQLYGLKLAQPSLCSSFESQTWQGPLFKDPRTVLHYTTFVEIMVPMFEMQFFVSKVVRTLEHAETGHGLDWVWPFSLAYPQEQIAIINDICVIHPKKELQPGTKLTIYQEHNPHAELVAVLAKFGYEAEILKSKYDMGYLAPTWLGKRWQPFYQELLDLAGITTTYEAKNAARGPNRGVRFIAVGGRPTLARLQSRHRMQSMAHAFSRLGSAFSGSSSTSSYNSGDIDIGIDMTVEEGIFAAGNRKFLVMVAAHSTSRWLQFNSSATYDTLAIASMQNAARVETSCRHCIFVYAHDLGTAVGRYAALPGLSESSQWKKQVAGKYDYIYFPQEEVVQTVESINRLFAVSQTYKLDLAQASWCSGDDTISPHMDLTRMQPITLLRYTTYVEVSAPVFSYNFWDTIVRTHLVGADQGAGLDFVWPYLAGYPEDKIAVVDDTCMMRPTHILGPSASTQEAKLSEDELTSRAQQEEVLHLVQVDYNPNKHRHIAYKPQDVISWVLQPWYQQLLTVNHLLVTPVRRWDIRLIVDDNPELGTGY